MPSKLKNIQIDYKIARLRLRIAFLSIVKIYIKSGFREAQPRGEDGRWIGGSDRLVVVRRDKTGNTKIDKTTDDLIEIVKNLHEKIGDGEGPSYGVQFHTMLAKEIRDFDLPGIGRSGIEQSFSFGDTVRYGTNGSIRTDVVLRDGRTEATPILAVWDFKTGSARLSSSRADEIRTRLRVESDIPVIENHIHRGVKVKHNTIMNIIRMQYNS